MKLHREVLDEAQRRALGAVGPAATERGFYLAGGAALGLRLGHRRSVDLDWFTEGDLGDPLRLAASFTRSGVQFSPTSMAPGTLHGSLMHVPTSFLDYPYPRLMPLGRAREGFRIASLDDLACMKLSAVVDRGAKKDFVDVYALCERHRPLGELIERYRTRFRGADPGHVLVALSYFDDAERQPMPKMLWDVDWPAIRRRIEEEVREAARRV